MARRDPRISLQQMIDHASEARDLASGKSQADLERDRVLNLALVRLLEIVGEAAARVPDEVRARHPEVPWPQIVALRNRLIHGYDEVDFAILWQILNGDLPPLIDTLRTIIQTQS